MPYLDKEEKFYDYHTSNIEGNNIFDIHKASNSDAQQLLDGSKYWREEKNTYSEIVEMTPYEYFEACAKDCFNEPIEKLIQSRRRDKNTLEHLKQVLQIYKKKFPICYIDYATQHNAQQEGLHRMMVAGDLYGWDTKFPVQIIKYVDEEKAKQAHEWKHIREIERYLQIAVERSLRYKYYNIEELKDQLKSEFETEVRYLDEFEDRDFKLDVEEVDAETLVATVDDKYKWEFPADDIQYLDASDKEDIDLEDIDFDDLSDWMKDLLADLEIEKHKLTEVYASVKEFLQSKELMYKLTKEFKEGFDSKPLCKEITEYIVNEDSRCKRVKVAGLYVLENYSPRPVSTSHYVIMDDNTVYDFTPNQFNNNGVPHIDNIPATLTFDDKLSKLFDCNIYSCPEYFVVVI